MLRHPLGKASLRAVFCLLTCLAGFVCSPGHAQEFRVYTKVSDLSGDSGREVVIGTSLSLCHAGKVYDLINNGAETEVIIYEPAHDRFVILNTTRNIATTVHFDEVRQKLELARHVTMKRIEEFQQMPSHAGEAFIQQLSFSLQPQLEAKIDDKAPRLTLGSPFLTYKVAGSSVEDAEVARFYLQYADAMARLNYVLHPQVLFPASRLLLNEHLRENQWMPIEVELQSKVGKPLHLRARHKIHWKLGAFERGLIHDWESLLKSSDVKQVPLAEYQRLLLDSQGSSRR